PRPSGPSAGVVAAAASGPVLETTFRSHFGANQFVPSISQFSTYNYAPIPLSAAIQTYLPGSGFNSRIYAFNHPGKHLPHAAIFRGTTPTLLWGHRSIMTIFNRNARNPQHVLDRSRFHAGKSYTCNHTHH